MSEEWKKRYASQFFHRNVGSIERFFSRIETYKKIYPRYERREDSYLGLAQLACALIIWDGGFGMTS